MNIFYIFFYHLSNLNPCNFGEKWVNLKLEVKLKNLFRKVVIKMGLSDGILWAPLGVVIISMAVIIIKEIAPKKSIIEKEREKVESKISWWLFGNEEFILLFMRRLRDRK